MLRRAMFCWLWMFTCGALSGCTICQGPDDHNYAAFGGLVERVDTAHGRAGSAFAPAELHPVGEISPPLPLDPAQPQPIDPEAEEPGEEIDPSRRLETSY